MSVLRNIVFYLIILVATVVTLLSLASLIYDVSYWYTKVLDFPRTQYLIVAVISLMLFVALNRKWRAPAIALTLGLVATIAIQSYDVLPYLIGKKQVTDREAGSVDEGRTVGIMLANVLITNRKAQDFLEIVRERDPDMLLVMEVDDWWMTQLQPLADRYQHSMTYPTDNAYGMALYSKYPLSEAETKFFNLPDVPSFHATVSLPSGERFRFHGMHPVAPVPSKKYPDNQGEKEVAFGKLAEMLADESLPVVVAGDYNDVSWSHTARLFQDKGQLANVRIGRGLYNSFDAQSWVMRWPLDHFFVSPRFSVVELDRLEAFGSDHFPMYARLALEE
ncbi:endonuclease/exonuclease/phosphatase family protein [Lewinella sp. IMCC34191]|uniref:endonuclease/exonuclease/phosphatase family protein n=1 Tax=Lewinella sp. IMCC34191 TaxID=2259172 RepID=UPI000E27EC2B|nr:endonuclease/exonuclease/phosphatase family protein [Lewinella sp. IMCC34191]